MAWTIIEVERHTGIPSRRICFWLQKGLLPSVERDKNNVAYFSKLDVEWVRWIGYLRQTHMSIKDVKHYVELAHKGDSTLQE